MELLRFVFQGPGYFVGFCILVVVVALALEHVLYAAGHAWRKR